MAQVAVKERPILMSGEFVRAILDGRKTQTRRVVKGVDRAHQMPYRAAGPNIVTHVLDAPDRGLCPYGSPGDLLYVRETFEIRPGVPNMGRRPTLARHHRRYRASDDEPFWRWRPSIHMPKWAARIWLRVTDVRVERVQEISEEDVLAEGVEPEYCCDGFGGYAVPSCGCMGLPIDDPVDTFARKWDALNADRGHPWDSNPWVWVVSFHPDDPPEAT